MGSVGKLNTSSLTLCDPWSKKSDATKMLAIDHHSVVHVCNYRLRAPSQLLQDSDIPLSPQT